MPEAIHPVYRGRVPALGCLLSVLLLPALARAEEAWVRVESAHVRVIAHAPESVARRMATELELARRSLLAALGAPREERAVQLVIFSSQREFEPFWPEFDGRARSVPGYSLIGPQRNYILLAADSESSALLRHEYAHLFLHQRYGPLPVWLEEGLAEFFATIRTSEREGVIGELQPGHLERLRHQRLLPPGVFFSVTKESPLYGERAEPNLFYAQAWATVHFLLLGGAKPELEKLDGLVRRLANGQGADAALQDVFGVLADQFETSLRAYLRRPARPGLRLVFTESETPAGQAGMADAREVAFRQADIFAQAKRFEEGRRRFGEALARYPEFAALYEQLGWMALWQEDHATAEQHFARAIAAGSEEPEIYFLHAKLLLEQKLGEVEAEPDRSSAFAVMRAELERALSLKPGDARAHDLLGFILLISRSETDAAIRELEQAVALDPAVAVYRIHLAQAFLQKRDFVGAQEVLEPALALAQEPGERASIEEMLRYLKTVTPRP